APNGQGLSVPVGFPRLQMRKVLGLLTEDFRLYHDLVAALKARDLPFVSLSFARRIPDTVGAVLTSPAEAERVRSRHVVAVVDIARTPGRRVQPPFEIRPTPGEVREIQRRSRLESGGLVTISSELAGAVARGDFSLEEAIARARRTQRRSKR